MGRDRLNAFASAARVGAVPTRADWLVDMRFTGRKTGKLLTRRVAVCHWVTREVATVRALRSLGMYDDSRLVDCVIRRRDEKLESHAEWVQRLKSRSGISATAFQS